MTSRILDLLYRLSYSTCTECDYCAESCPWYPVFRPSERVKGIPEAVEHCTMCGKCVATCPLGVPVHKRVYDLRTKRGLLDEELLSIRKKSEEIGHSFGAKWEPVVRRLKFMGYPVDEPAEWLFVPSAFDSLPHSFNDLLAEVWLLMKLGYDFTLSSEVAEGYGNFIFDLADPNYFKGKALKILRIANELGVRGLIIGECGADYKVWPRLHLYIGKRSRLKTLLLPKAIYEKLDKVKPLRRVPGKVAYHDPCGLSRYNFIIKEPREILKKVCEDFVDRPPGGKLQICCGGGGGVSFSRRLTEDAIRIIGPKKVKQFNGVDLVVTSCAKCKSMLMSYSVRLRGGFRVQRLSYVVAWSMGLDGPKP